MRRRSLIRTAAAIPAAMALPALAQPRWPERPVTVVHPFAPGGQSEAIGRVLTNHLSRVFGQPFVWDYRTGAGGVLAAQHVARAAPDGHTVMFATTGVFVIAPFVQRNPGYDAVAAFAPVGLATEVPVVLSASRRSGFRSVADAVAAARARPGTVSFASAGAGSFPHLVGELFASLHGLQLIHVAYRGGAPALQDLTAGQVDLMFEGISTVAPQAEGGRLTPLLVTGAQRHRLLPDVPTVREAGLPDLDLASWNGFVAPAGTPPAVLGALNREVGAALAAAEMQELAARLGVTVVGGTPEEMAARIAREAAVYRRIVASANISAD